MTKYTSEKTQNKVQPTTMAKKKLAERTLLKKKKEKYANPIGLSGIHKQIEDLDLKVEVLAGKCGNPDCASQSINAIDFLSFWLFSTIFVVFNITYWNYYLD